MTGPREEMPFSQGKRYHAVQNNRVVRDVKSTGSGTGTGSGGGRGGDSLPTQCVWEYEEQQIFMMPTMSLLVRIYIGEVRDMDRLEAIIRMTPVGGKQQLMLPPTPRLAHQPLAQPVQRVAQSQPAQPAQPAHPLQSAPQQRQQQQQHYPNGHGGVPRVESGAGSGRSASAPGGGGAPSVAWVGEVVSSVLQDPRAIWTKPGMGWEQVKDGSLWYLDRSRATEDDGTNWLCHCRWHVRGAVYICHPVLSIKAVLPSYIRGHMTETNRMK